MELSALRHRPTFGVQLRSRRRGLILHRHDHLPLFIRTLPETIASATGQRGSGTPGDVALFTGETMLIALNL